jgi:hypothetical protein
VDPGAKLRRVAAHLYPAQLALCQKSGVNRVIGVAKDRHGAVAEPFDQAAPMPGDRRVLGCGDLAQQLQRRLVARLERPGREADDVGEQDRDVELPATPALRLGKGLPRLQGAQPELANGARPLGLDLGDQAPDPLRDLGARGGQRVAVLVVAGKEPPEELGGRHELGPGIGAASSLRELPGLAWGHRVLALRRSLAARFPIVAHSGESSPISGRRA